MATPDPISATGGCHCGTVRFTVRLDQPTAVLCTCSICTMKGFVHLIVPHDALEIHQGREHLTEYRFLTRTARHTFCARCGIHPFYVPRSHPDGWSVNARCLDDQALAAGIPRQSFDGRHWEAHIDELR